MGHSITQLTPWQTDDLSGAENLAISEDPIVDAGLSTPKRLPPTACSHSVVVPCNGLIIIFAALTIQGMLPRVRDATPGHQCAELGTRESMPAGGPCGPLYLASAPRQPAREFETRSRLVQDQERTCRSQNHGVREAQSLRYRQLSIIIAFATGSYFNQPSRIFAYPAS